MEVHTYVHHTQTFQNHFSSFCFRLRPWWINTFHSIGGDGGFNWLKAHNEHVQITSESRWGRLWLEESLFLAFPTLLFARYTLKLIYNTKSGQFHWKKNPRLHFMKMKYNVSFYRQTLPIYLKHTSHWLSCIKDKYLRFSLLVFTGIKYFVSKV